ncbi:MAG TPA: FTR1 family protein [Myxococcales bacterium]|jgi:high-affinity iron transporter|nr:FTR1 family protein [Myxococcales bacterium]
MILSLTLVAAAAPAQPGEAQPLRRAVALLDYVSGDYARAVGEHGELLSPAEHQEQIGFLEDAARELRADAGAKGEDLAKQLDALGQRAAARAPPSEVTQAARALRDEIAERFQVVLLPQHAPDLVRGARVYAQSCAACHGADGHPNLSLGLETKPPDFRTEAGALSPRRIFSAATYGVPKTQMPAYDTGLSDSERWDVAFYVLSLAHPGASPRGLTLARAALLPTRYAELASLADDELRARLVTAGLSQQEQEAALAALRGGPFAETSDPLEAQGLAQARSAVQKAVAQARRGERDGARGALISAYLDHFEAHEAGLRARDGRLVQEIEAAFLALRGSIDGKDSALDQNAAKLDALLEKADARGPGGGLVAFVAALAIALREGVEAALLVAAMLALLRKAGRSGDAHAVHAGWLSALLAGAATWWVSGMLLVRLSGAHRELIEGVLQLVLAGLILYASHWLFAAMSSRRVISAFFQRSSAGAGAAVVAGLTFVAVYREAFETVLFFRGLLLEEPGNDATVAAGAFAGLLGLVALVAGFQRLGRKLKPRPLLLACGVLLCTLAVLMVGNGVRSLQVLGVLPLTVWGAFQVPALGLYATREGLLAQGLVLAALVASALWTSRGRDGDKSGPAKREAAAAVQ